MTALLLRSLLRAWGLTGIAPGWRYHAIERWGAAGAARGPLMCRLPNASRVSCDLRDHVQRHMYYLGCYEPVEAYLFSRLLSPGMTVFDIGANVGQYTLLSSSAIGVNGRVHSFEPIPKNFDRLVSALSANRLRNVIANNVAVWEKNQTLRLGLPSDEVGNDGAYSVGGSSSANAISGRAVALDDYVDQHGITKIDVIKMDIEGAELPALRGMLRLLRRDQPLILMEVNRAASENAGHSTAEIWDLLARQLGYRAWMIGHTAETCRTLEHLEEIQQSNIVFHVTDLPAGIRTGWNTRGALKWARKGAT
jgi:FkbM family methyltransferase